MKQSFFAMLVALAVGGGASAQMQFAFSSLPGNGQVTTAQCDDGVTLLELPSGTDLSCLGDYGLTVTVDGAAVAASDITPNPATTYVTDNEIEVFTYRNKAYAFRFTASAYFTAVLFSDPHIAQTDHDGTSVADMQGYVRSIVNMGKTGGQTFAFDALPHYVPTADIVFCLGDMDGDSEKSGSNFKSAVAGLNTAGIPFLTMCGNHDLVPDYWTGDNPDKGLTYGSSGGASCNSVALTLVKDQAKEAQKHGIADYQTFTSNDNLTQFDPYTFTFRGVRFYIGQTYWFQKPYEKPGLLTAAKYYAPDGLISTLDTFVGQHRDDASVWMQHYPFVAGSDCNRWWLDQNDKGKYIKTEDASAYGTHDDVAVYTDASASAVAQTKKDALAAIINKTKNPYCFSGHTHGYSRTTYAGLTDYTVAGTGAVAGSALIVLMKSGEGVVEVKQVTLNNTPAN